MPIVFLSPSTQDWNPYVTGSGSEEYWMNRIVDAMEPYLRSNGIRYRRNDPDTSAGPPSGRPTAAIMTSIWHCTPTPSETAPPRPPPGALSPFTIPAAPVGSGEQS